MFLYKLTLDNKDISKYYFYMKYLILGVIFISSSIFALDTEIESQTDPVDCLQLNKHQHLSPAESKNLLTDQWYENNIINKGDSLF